MDHHVALAPIDQQPLRKLNSKTDQVVELLIFELLDVFHDIGMIDTPKNKAFEGLFISHRES
jgi:hypothetical protein